MAVRSNKADSLSSSKQRGTQNLILGILVSIAGILLPLVYVWEGGFLLLPHALTALFLGIVLMVAILKVLGF